jgi:transcriptional regulator with XRE-family HTH domain
MSAGEQIRALREQRRLRPSDIERLSQRLAEQRGNPDYLMPHGTLNGIESGSVPTIYKLASLASILQIRIEDLLLIYGINGSKEGSPKEVIAGHAETAQNALFAQGEIFAETQLLQDGDAISELLPSGVRDRVGGSYRFRYGIVGANDDILSEILPGGSFVEIDRDQTTIARFPWTSMSERPIYFLWHDEGHACCWCDQTGNVLTIVPHPLSRRKSKQFRLPREVTIIGRVTNSWRCLTARD